MSFWVMVAFGFIVSIVHAFAGFEEAVLLLLFIIAINLMEANAKLSFQNRFKR